MKRILQLIGAVLLMVLLGLGISEIMMRGFEREFQYQEKTVEEWYEKTQGGE